METAIIVKVYKMFTGYFGAGGTFQSIHMLNVYKASSYELDVWQLSTIYTRIYITGPGKFDKTDLNVLFSVKLRVGQQKCQGGTWTSNPTRLSLYSGFI